MVFTSVTFSDRASSAVPPLGVNLFFEQAKCCPNSEKREREYHVQFMANLNHENAERLNNDGVRVEWLRIRILAILVLASWVSIILLFREQIRLWPLMLAAQDVAFSLDSLCSKVSNKFAVLN